MMFGRKSISFNSGKDIPDLGGKVILITGGNAGLGKQAALEFARHNPKELWIACRSVDKAQRASNDILEQVPTANIKLIELDLSSFASVERAANEFLSKSDRLDILMLNAGIMATGAALTEDGYETQFGTNHMGHALLTKLILPALHKATDGDRNADVRVVAVASRGHVSVETGDFQFDALKNTADSLGPYGRYFQSKLANVLWAREFAKSYPEFTVASIHPGVVQTQLMDRSTGTPGYIKLMVKVAYRFLTTAEEGVKNQLWASVSKEVVSGEYYEPVGVRNQASANGVDDVLARKLWEWTQNELDSYKSQ